MDAIYRIRVSGVSRDRYDSTLSWTKSGMGEAQMGAAPEGSLPGL